MKSILRKIAKAISGSFSIGNLTVYGDNAMHFGCTYWTNRYGYICWRLPLPCGVSDKILYGDKICWRPLYFYISRNATPLAAVFMLGKKHSPRDWKLAPIRKLYFGWNYNTDDEIQHNLLWKINGLT